MPSTVQETIDRNIEHYRNELFELLRIPSISTDPDCRDHMEEAARFLAEQFRTIGLEKAAIMETGGHPVVYAEYCPHPDAPVVLIYGHYDVQPPDPLGEWNSPPFEPTVLNGRVYARGASDDKGQSFTHIKAVEAYLKSGMKLPVNIKFLYEGEEEIGSPSLLPFIQKHRDLLACDMVLVSDTAMFGEDRPSITIGLKGLTYMEVNVVGPERDLHSGVYGGGVENPAIALAAIISRLKDDRGRVNIPGFYDDVRPLEESEREEMRSLPFDEEAYRKELGVRRLHGEAGYTTLERTTARPTLDVNGLWSGYQGKGAKTVLPARAGAKISMRLVPDQHPKDIARLFTEYVNTIAPETVSVSVTEHHGGEPVLVDRNFYGIRAACEAFRRVYGKDALLTREGGSIPVVADFQRILGAPTILMGFGLSRDALHSPNESFSLRDFHRGIKTSATFLGLLPEYASGQEGSG